ncbi:MAG: hypothetical protein AB7P34_15215 [Vicinamibacterales bacterium]
MTIRTTAAIVTTCLLMAATAGLEADTRLALKVTPNISSAPSTVVVRALVAKNADNRVLHIGADSGSFYRSSEIQLDGENAPLVTEIRLKNLPSGEYTVVAILRDQMGHQTSVRQTVLVLSRHGEP